MEWVRRVAIRSALIRDVAHIIQIFIESHDTKPRARLMDTEGFTPNQLADAIVSELERLGWHGVREETLERLMLLDAERD